MTRTAYGIQGGSAQWDCCTAIFCPCCTANQIYQTTKARGHIPVPNVGPEFNVNERIAFTKRTPGQLLYDALYSILCAACADGLALKSAGFPFWFGCLCMSPFNVSQVVRYRRKIRPMCGSETMADCCVPGLVAIGMSFIPYVGIYIADCPMTFCALSEDNAYTDRTGCYGCDFMGCCANIFAYLGGGCTCPDKEGRYLTEEAM